MDAPFESSQSYQTIRREMTWILRQPQLFLSQSQLVMHQSHLFLDQYHVTLREFQLLLHHIFYFVIAGGERRHSMISPSITQLSGLWKDGDWILERNPHE
jgi:hypothetical protein